METKFGFLKITPADLESWIHSLSVGRTILKIQLHHTYLPAYEHFGGSNHFELQRSMRNHHVHANGWNDIGQHFTVFPDGVILTGRSLELTPACIYQNNQDSICIENLGYFDIGKDEMREEQKQSIVKLTALFCKKFNFLINTDTLVYHHWFRLDNGHRNNGAGGNKSCPGTNFFGGNKVEDCDANFIPLVRQELAVPEPPPLENTIIKYVIVTAYRLNVRLSHSSRSHLAPDRDPVRRGSVLRVYEEEKGWLKISHSKNHWVYGRYTDDVERYVVNTTTLNVRSGPGIHFERVGQVFKNEQVFSVEQEGNWAKIAMDNRWVSMHYLTEYSL